MINKHWETSKKFSEADVTTFSNLTGDNNRIHIDSEYAKESIFGKRVVHGIFVTSLFSKIFGTVFPGEGSIYLEQEVKFIAPVFIGDLITARVILEKFDEIKLKGIFKCLCINQNGDTVIIGNAIIKFPPNNTAWY